MNGVIWIGGVIKDGKDFYEGHIKPIHDELTKAHSNYKEIKKILDFCDELKEYKTVYVANQNAVLELIKYLKAVKIHIKLLDPVTKEFPNLKFHIKQLKHALQQAQDLIKEQIMPNNLNKFQMAKWCGKRIVKAKSIQSKFTEIDNVIGGKLMLLGAASSMVVVPKLAALADTHASQLKQIKQLIEQSIINKHPHNNRITLQINFIIPESKSNFNKEAQAVGEIPINCSLVDEARKARAIVARLFEDNPSLFSSISHTIAGANPNSSIGIQAEEAEDDRIEAPKFHLEDGFEDVKQEKKADEAKANPGVIVETIKAGDGKIFPKSGQIVTIHYTATLKNLIVVKIEKNHYNLKLKLDKL